MNLLELATKKEINPGLIYDFIEKGGADFIHQAFIETMFEEMVELDFMDNYTPIGAVAHSRDVLASIFNDFKAEFDQANPE